MTYELNHILNEIDRNIADIDRIKANLTALRRKVAAEDDMPTEEVSQGAGVLDPEDAQKRREANDLAASQAALQMAMEHAAALQKRRGQHTARAASGRAEDLRDTIKDTLAAFTREPGEVP